MPATYPVSLTDPTGVTTTQVDPTHAAQRHSIQPYEHILNSVIGGHFSMVATYSNTAAKPAAGSDVVSLRWLDSRNLLLVFRIQVWITTTTGYTAVGNQDLALFKATGFSVSASAGTNILPIAGSQQRMRVSNMNPTLMSNPNSAALWVSSGDLLTVGTRTLDTQPIGYVAYLNSTAASAPTNAVLFDCKDFGRHPMVLGSNEGLVLQTPLGNAQAAGVSKYAFQIDWAEIAAF